MKNKCEQIECEFHKFCIQTHFQILWNFLILSLLQLVGRQPPKLIKNSTKNSLPFFKHVYMCNMWHHEIV
jgi:hypothetical protein